jgi:hypothetical protein
MAALAKRLPGYAGGGEWFQERAKPLLRAFTGVRRVALRIRVKGAWNGK